eukprot:scaffold22784_cov34-Tisochrysis_lutea.AAC.2
MREDRSPWSRSIVRLTPSAWASRTRAAKMRHSTEHDLATRRRRERTLAWRLVDNLWLRLCSAFASPPSRVMKRLVACWLLSRARRRASCDRPLCTPPNVLAIFGRPRRP